MKKWKNKRFKKALEKRLKRQAIRRMIDEIRKDPLFQGYQLVIEHPHHWED